MLIIIILIVIFIVIIFLFLFNWKWIKANNEQLIVLLTLLILFAAIWIGYVQNGINKKSLEIETHAEIFAYYDTSGTITLRNTGTKSLYIQDYILDGVRDSPQYESLIPPGQMGTYRISIPSWNPQMNLQISYRDAEWNRYTTNITIKKENSTLDVYTHQQVEL